MHSRRFSFIIALVFFAGMDPAAVQAASIFPIADNLNVPEFSAGIAFGATNYLVAMQVGTNVTGQLVSTNGTLQGSQISVGSNPGFPPNIALAFAQTNYLLAWSDNSIGSGIDMFGQFISRNGTKVGSRFNLLSNVGDHGFQYVEALASDGTNFLVVWADGYNSFSQTSGNIYGQMVTPSGSLAGPEFLISGQAQNGNSAAATFGRTNYLVVWQSNPANMNDEIGTYAALVSQSGSAGNVFQISQTVSQDQNPLAAAFDGTNYLAVWSWDPPPETGISVTNWDLYGRVITQTGGLPGSELHLVTGPGSQYIPSLAFGGSNYLMGWSDMHWNADGSFNTTNYDMDFQFFDRSGNPVGSQTSYFPWQGTNGPLLTFNGLIYDGSRFCAVAMLGTVAFTAGNISGFPSSEVYGAFIPQNNAPAPLPQLTPLNFSGGQFSFQLSGIAGTNYIIQASTNLDGNNWVPIATNTASGGTFNFTDSHATNSGRFYRAVQQ